MKNFLKLILSCALFTVVFFIFRSPMYYNLNTLLADLGGLAYLYSTVVFIFAIFAAFVIFFEAERWNSLVDAVKGEVGQLNELYLWSRHLPENLKSRFSTDIKKYLEVRVNSRLHYGNKKNLETEETLNSLHNDIYQILKDEPTMMPTAFSAFSDLMKFREKRIHYSHFHLPKILKYTLYFNSVLLILFSFLIAVKNVWLAYIFVLGIFALVESMFLLIDDLDHPMRPGSFHITTDSYQELLDNINKN
ncbi:MAG: DUF4239 domain-containing protein [Candidatus Nomurabacteria bacterium]|nr:DUF4239 domain-containing protein [Candidatus Nomurabacteria bacterium]